MTSKAKTYYCPNCKDSRSKVKIDDEWMYVYCFRIKECGTLIASWRRQ